MRRSLLSLILIFGIGQLLIAQQIKYISSSKPDKIAEKLPEFPGGPEAFKEFCQSPVDRFRDYNCTVELSCVVEKDGSLNKIKALAPNDKDDCTAEAVKILKRSPKWIPGSIAGKPVSVQLSITVQLDYVAPDFVVITSDKNLIYNNVEEVATYIGGMDAFRNYMKSNLKYPPLAIKNGTEGKVVVSFVIELNGKLADIKIMRGIGDGCDEEALRLIRKTSRKWMPGKNKNIAVRTRYAIPVYFDLSGNRY